jgi:dipeptidyl aminopeptidase/acylaminoacyl peptidase
VADTYVMAQDLYRIVTLSDPRFSPDGRRLAYVRTEIDRESNGYKSAIWVSPIEGGRPRQFTSGTKRDHSPRWSPDGRWLAFVSNRGDDKAQIFVMATDGGEALPLTQAENGAGNPVWSPDGRHLGFTARLNAEEMVAEQEPEPDGAPDPNEQERRAEEKKKREEKKADPRVIDRFRYRAETQFFDGRTSHLYVIEIDPETGQAPGPSRRLTQEERDYTDPRWMPDGAALLAVATRHPDEDDLFYYSDLVRVPLDGGQVEILTTPDTADHSPRPSPDGQWIAYHSVPTKEISTANTQIKVMPAAGGEARILTEQLDAHAWELAWMPGGQDICFLVPRRGRVDLCQVATSGGPIHTLLTADWEVLDYDLAPEGHQVAFVTSTDRLPWNLYMAELDPSSPAPDQAPRRLLAANENWLADKKLGQVEDLWFEGSDGTPLQGWIVKPPGLDPQARYPLVLSIHGGPHVMWSRHESTMWHEWQVLAAQGYVVLACNPRGSDGYGRDFRAALRNHWGEADLPDLLAAVEKALALEYVDGERLVVTGGSYGGFMTAWLIGHSDRFSAAVAQRGVYDLSSFYGTTDIPRLVEWEFDNAPWDDPQHLWKYSPLAYVEEIHTPLLLIHAENDFRAPIPTAESLFVALRRLSRQVQMVRYPRDGHELSRSGEPKHRVDRLERIVGWFDRFVK